MYDTLVVACPTCRIDTEAWIHGTAQDSRFPTTRVHLVACPACDAIFVAQQTLGQDPAFASWSTPRVVFDACPGELD